MHLDNVVFKPLENSERTVHPHTVLSVGLVEYDAEWVVAVRMLMDGGAQFEFRLTPDSALTIGLALMNRSAAIRMGRAAEFAQAEGDNT